MNGVGAGALLRTRNIQKETIEHNAVFPLCGSGPPCCHWVIKKALGHMTVDEQLFRIRPELGPRGSATVTTPNGVFSVGRVCVCVLY